ncbi:Metallo-dependent phosphatase-like protein [Catenaria anguillulae PL171]|uniref:Metallo-dependent phosphatase-like protein n=1 Tax=Catenaria anguillulae PL171 TaxID=765915 RepID=A0A1Y2HPS2_9FUNG|nr:Metallo-dependent phosphatase-like protein [Catenaria anguillulae PL171]
MTLIHTNDIHARMDEFSSSGIDCTEKNRADRRCFGGIARIKTLVDSIREKDPNVYMVDAGDEFQGTLFYNYYKGNVTAEYMNAIGLDAFAVGNHEFDDGPAHLGNFIKKLNMPAISSNIDTSAEPGLNGLIAPYTVFTKYVLRFGTRIGCIGFITRTTPDISAAGRLAKFSDPAGANGPVQRAVDKLHSLGIKRIIAVSHNGLEDDRVVAASTKGISVIVGGHSHSLMHKNSSLAGVRATYPLPVKNAAGEDTYIVQAKAWGEWVGRLQISWDAESKLTALNGDPIQLTMDIPQHNATQEIVKKWREPFDAIAKTVIGSTPNAMSRGSCNGIGCAIGWFVADTLRQSYKSPANNPVIGMTNVGGLRSDIAAGDITVGTILTVLPFPNTATTVPMTGAQVVAMLENIALTQNSDGLRADGKKVTSFAQYAGLRAELDSSKAKFARVSKVEVEVSEGKWEALDAAKTYEIVMVDFLSNIGGDAILPAELVKNYETRQMLSDLALEYVKAAKVLDIPAAKFQPGVRFVAA